MNDTLQVFAELDTVEARIEELIRRQWWTSIPLTTFSASQLLSGEQRLDGGFYARESFRAYLVLQESKYPIQNFSTVVSDTFVLGRFKRIYASDKQSGWPYLSASESLIFRPHSDRYLAKNHAPKHAEKHFAKKGWILLSCSGTVGRPVIVTKRLEKFFLTHDLIRIIPDNEMPVGYLYAYLSSWIGQSLITKDQYGSAIKHLEPHHIGNTPVPLVGNDTQQSIHDKIMEAFNLRDEANALLDEADTLLHDLLNLSRFDEKMIEYYQSPDNDSLIPSAKSFTLKATELDDRLDGSYHVPIAKTAIALVKQAKYEAVQLGNIVDRVYVAPRFRRIYVPKEYGVPLLQGSHLPQMKPMGLKYISHTQTKGLKRWVIRQDWVLVTCSGTIGRIGLVSSAQDGWAASQHILRIIAQENTSHSGYIAAFLSTPYGQHQLTSKIYGAVVDELTEADTEAVWIPNAPYDIQEQIGCKVIEAYEKKEQANQVEAESIQRLEAILENQP